jgi:hypothetical protein
MCVHGQIWDRNAIKKCSLHKHHPSCMMGFMCAGSLSPCSHMVPSSSSLLLLLLVFLEKKNYY